VSLSQNIKRLRLEKGMTQEQFANILGVSAQAVSKWETSETYPDGALLVPLANALGVSLDVLFDNRTYSMEDISERIQRLIKDTPREKRFHLVRNLCWQMEKGLFFFSEQKDFVEKYSPDEICNQKQSSYILNDYGFTHISNGRAPFFSVFPECGEGFSNVIGDGENVRKLFEALSSPEAMRVLLFIHKQKADYIFEAEVLARACEMEVPLAKDILNRLIKYKLVSFERIDIDGEQRVLYHACPSHKMIALLLFAHELNYRGSYCLQAENRNKPFLK
jgi:transcriptional regulator with XRE-family HTH domain